MKIKVSKNPQTNWQNDAIQFPRFIAELDSLGVFTDEVMRGLANETGLTRTELIELYNRAESSWDSIKQQLINPLNPKPKDEPTKPAETNPKGGHKC